MSKGTGKNAGKDITDTLNRGLDKLNGLIKRLLIFSLLTVKTLQA